MWVAVNPAPFLPTQDLTEQCPWAQGQHCGGSGSPHSRGQQGACDAGLLWGRVASEWHRGEESIPKGERRRIFCPSGFPESEEHRAQVQTRCPVSCVADWSRASLGAQRPRTRPQCRGPRPDPWVGNSAWGRAGNPLQDSCLENPMDRGAWRATVHGIARVEHDLATKLPPKGLNLFNVVKEEHSCRTEAHSGGHRKEAFLHVKGV